MKKLEAVRLHKPKVEIKILNHHKIILCEGCKKSFKQKHISWFAGHYLCGSCRMRKKMPLVGYKNREVWKVEERLKKKDRKMPYLTWTERRMLWGEYMKKGLTSYEAKSRIRSINAVVAKNCYKSWGVK